MALSSFVQTNFLGGEISQSAQGRMDRPDYKISLNVCLNSIPIESGALLRRPGTRNVAPTRGGKQGKLISFPFRQSYPYVMEFTDGYLRFTTGPNLAQTNDSLTVTAISAANPAQVTTSATHSWSTGNTVLFPTLSGAGRLQNRQFVITSTGSATFTLADAITGASIDGSALGSAFSSGTVARVLEIATPYTGTSWSNLRSVQAEDRSVLLNGTKPQILQVSSDPGQNSYAGFSLSAADFNDGPYLDPVDGSWVSSSALNGVVTLTFSFQTYDASKAYNIGDFVSSSGLSFKSLTALNQGHTPVSSPANWLQVNGGAAVNNGAGFVASDVGRLIRLLSEPPLWIKGNTYNTGDVAAYDDGSGGFSYWTATQAGVTAQPGISGWALNATGARWTWAQVLSVSGSGLVPSSGLFIGTLTGGGGGSSAFDGGGIRTFASAANFTDNIPAYPPWSVTAQQSGAYLVGTLVQYNGTAYQAAVNVPADTVPPTVGPFWHFWATVPPSNAYFLYLGELFPAGQQIVSATVFGTSDVGITFATDLAINLRASNTAPTSSSDGVILGATGRISNVFQSVTIVSSDQTTSYKYIWIEIGVRYYQPLAGDSTNNYQAKIGLSQIQFQGPNVSNGAVITAQIRGDALLYSGTIRTWRLGLYSDTSGWPTCGTYHEGRIWLGGVIENRFDASLSNGFNGIDLDFTPTAPNGTVADNHAISYVCTGEDINEILWMTPDQQGVLFGTQAGEWLISAPAQGALSPLNIRAVRVTKIGCADIEPRRAEHTLLFVQKFARKVMEYFADVFSGKFSAPNLTERAKHLTTTSILEIAYQQELAPIMWARRTDGGLIGVTYKRETLTTSQGPSIVGWHRHLLGSGRTVESLCTGPSSGGNLDTLTMITNDQTTGVRHIELMTDLLDENFVLTACWFLDDAIVPTSTTIQNDAGGPYGSIILNGLWQHNGKTVTAFLAGLDCGDYVVSNGSITVPFGDGVSGGSGSGLFTKDLVQSFATLPAVVGFTYNSDGQLVRSVTPQDTGAQSGPGFAKNRRYHRIAAQIYGAVNGSFSIGTDFATLYPAKLTNLNGTPYTVQQLWSGIFRDSSNSIYDFDGMIAWRVSRPLPVFVTAVGGFGAAQDA